MLSLIPVVLSLLVFGGGDTEFKVLDRSATRQSKSMPSVAFYFLLCGKGIKIHFEHQNFMACKDW